MIVRIEIMNKPSGKIKSIEKQGDNRLFTLMKFYSAIAPYAKKENKIIKVETDDPTVIVEMQKNYPDVHFILLGADGKEIGSMEADEKKADAEKELQNVKEKHGGLIERIAAKVKGSSQEAPSGNQRATKIKVRKILMVGIALVLIGAALGAGVIIAHADQINVTMTTSTSYTTSYSLTTLTQGGQTTTETLQPLGVVQPAVVIVPTTQTISGNTVTTTITLTTIWTTANTCTVGVTC
ncbi:MAG: hypothetical protein ACRDF4_03235 [Rhabdochlamydiaceae bacterium]